MPENPDASWWGHEARLGRVVTNLPDNALRSRPNGVVKVRRVGAEASWLLRTRGPASSDKLRTYSSVSIDRPQTDRTVGKNSGLGLSISREIVQAYGGRIWASNRAVAPGAETFALDEQVELRERRVDGVVGARFTVRLPAADATPSRGAPSLARRG